MVKFSLFALSSLLCTVQASSQNLRAPVATTTTISSTTNDKTHRNLSYEYIARYRPASQVTDHNAIDLDQKIIEEQIARQTESSFALAKSIYEEGGHSKSYARLTITSTETPTEADGTVFKGIDNLGFEVNAKVYERSSTPSNELWLQYNTIDIQRNYVGCQVGALAKTGDEKIDGCFQGPTGTVSSGPKVYSYSYDPKANTFNGRTIKGFSTSVQSKMLDCANCPYKDAKYFVDYYGNADYADKWITAAFTGGQTNFLSGRGNASFNLYGLIGRGECAKKGTAYMAIFMYVLREFEDAIDDCKANCISCNDDPVHAWDEGVAFYSGSLEGEDGVPTGKLMHELADKRCVDFNTCVDESNSRSHVNNELLNLFNIGQGQLQSGLCTEARQTKEKIADLMYIPLIQGTLRYAYKVGKQSGGEKEKAEGAVFAAAVLPRIHAANEKAADVIYNNMRVGASSTDFKTVKKAFESVYKDLNIKCSDVGGLVSPEGGYFEEAGPCNDGGSAKKSGSVAGIAFGSVAGAIALSAIGYIFYMRRRERNGNPVFKPVAEAAANMN